MTDSIPPNGGPAAAALVPAMAAPLGWAARAEGPFVWGEDGRRRIDLAGGVGVNILGHGHRRVTAAIVAQARALTHAGPGLGHRPYAELCARLAELGAGERVFLCNSGAEAVEAALKLARLFFARRGRPRPGFVACHGSFHGRTLGALAVSGQLALRAGFEPPLPGASFVPFNDLAALGRAVGPDTAAVLVEPIQGSGGVVAAASGYLAGVADICRAQGALLILDEVQTGIGRTGAWFAAQHDGVVPDLMCLAKALGGGLPLGACAMRAEVAEVFTRGSHGTTFGGNPIACAAALATLQVIAEESLLGRAGILEAQVAAVAGAGGPLAGHLTAPLRGRGALVGLPVGPRAPALRRALWGRGVLTTVAAGEVLRLFLPLNIPADTLAEALEIIAATINAPATS